MSTPRNIKDRAVSQLAGPTLIPGGFATANKESERDVFPSILWK